MRAMTYTDTTKSCIHMDLADPLGFPIIIQNSGLTYSGRRAPAMSPSWCSIQSIDPRR